MDSVTDVPGRSLKYASLLLRLCRWLNINHDITWFVESPFCSHTFNEATERCNWYSSFLSLQKWSGLAVQRKWWSILYREFFFRFISVTSKAKEGQVAILVYGRRCALVHGSVNKSCENRRPDSSRDMLIPLTNGSAEEKEKKKNKVLPWHHERTQWKFKGGFCLEESVLILWLHKPRKGSKIRKSRKDKREKDNRREPGSRTRVRLSRARDESCLSALWSEKN